MKKILALLLLIALSPSCADAITLYPTGRTNSWSEAGVSWAMRGEYTVIRLANGDLREFYNDDPEYVPVKRRDSSDPAMLSWGTPTATTVNLVFGSVAQDPNNPNILYMIGGPWTGGVGYPAHTAASHMYKSTDYGASWNIVNGGNTVLTQSSDQDNVYYSIYNRDLHIVDNTFHLFIECAKGGALAGSGENGWGTAYSSAPLGDTVNFDTNKTASWILPRAVAPVGLYVPARNGWVLAHGYFVSDKLLDGHGGVHSAMRFCASLPGASPGQASSWYYNGAQIEGAWIDANNRSSLSDAALYAASGKTHSLLLNYNYNQDSERIMTSDMTPEQLYDALLDQQSSIGGVTWSGGWR